MYKAALTMMKNVFNFGNSRKEGHQPDSNLNYQQKRMPDHL